jgi:hypothetical protein
MLLLDRYQAPRVAKRFCMLALRPLLIVDIFPNPEKTPYIEDIMLYFAET